MNIATARWAGVTARATAARGRPADWSLQLERASPWPSELDSGVGQRRHPRSRAAPRPNGHGEGARRARRSGESGSCRPARHNPNPAMPRRFRPSHQPPATVPSTPSANDHVSVGQLFVDHAWASASSVPRFLFPVFVPGQGQQIILFPRAARNWQTPYCQGDVCCVSVRAHAPPRNGCGCCSSTLLTSGLGYRVIRRWIFGMTQGRQPDACIAVP